MKNFPIRGFKNLIGKTIKNIDSSCCNVVVIETSDGNTFEITNDDVVIGIGIIRCDVVKKPQAK